MNPWTWTVFELMTFPFDNTMIKLARQYPLSTIESLVDETKELVIERGFASIYE